MAEVKRSSCLYNNQIVRIEEFFTIREGKQINIPEMVEKFHDLGRKNKLFCPCGCNMNLILAAGEKGVQRQHFRRKGELRNCRANLENKITTYSKIVLKCWLDDVFHLNQGEIRFNVPVSQIHDINRKYEYTHFVTSKNFGLSYERASCNWEPEKIELLLSHSREKLLHIMDISNGGCIGQYPEYKMRVQKLQGYCALLDTHGSFDYLNTDLKITIYEQDYRGLWKEILIADGKLFKFFFDEKFNLKYSDENITAKVDECRERFRKLQDDLKKEAEEKAERIKAKKIEEEKEAARIIEEQQKAAEEKRRIIAEKEEVLKREKAERIQKQREEQKRKRLEYVQLNPKLSHFYQYLSNVDVLEGRFFSKQSNGQIKTRKEKITVRDIDYQVERKRFEVQDEYFVKYFIYVDDSPSGMNRSNASNSYANIPLNQLDIDEIIPYFRKYFNCIKKQEYVQELMEKDDKIDNRNVSVSEEVHCQLNGGCPHLIKDDNLCGYPDSQCAFRKFE